ncbi:MAG: hypothetical protein U0939_16345 [Pirellulales bacterium]
MLARLLLLIAVACLGLRPTKAHSDETAEERVRAGQLPESARDYFAIRVVDESTGRGVPLVELRTTNELRFVTDSAGYVAFRELGLMDREVYFHLHSHGYETPQDGLGFRGRKLTTTPGRIAVWPIKRRLAAERLYRITGAGIYADSQLLGVAPPDASPPLNAHVMGSDSVVCAVHRERIHWFWGDTNRPDYPLGIFNVPGAVSPLPHVDDARQRWSPERGVPLSYFVDGQGRAKETAKMPGTGPTWINGVASVPDDAGRATLLCTYEKIRPPLDVYARGIAQFDEERQEFVAVATLPVDAPLRPFGHPLRGTAGDAEYVYFGDPFPWTRTKATRAAYLDLSQYEGFTAVRGLDAAGAEQLERDAQGRLVFAWRRGAAPWSWELEQKLANAGQLRDDERRLQLIDPNSGKPITPHRGTVNWNVYLGRWIAIFVQLGGQSSMLGEVWFAEAPALEGPWTRATKIVTHDKYSFYNPNHHVFLDEENGRRIYFEATYTQMFSGAEKPTPRYEYNQLMYRLDLAPFQQPP